MVEKRIESTRRRLPDRTAGSGRCARVPRRSGPRMAWGSGRARISGGSVTIFLSGLVGDRPRTWPLDGPVLAVGRSSRHPIHIPDGTVSKDHAEITFRAGQYYLRGR